MTGLEPDCPYCGNKTYPVKGTDIYPDLKKLEGEIFYKCQPCFAWVGCHPGTAQPLGIPANRETRIARSAGHKAFCHAMDRTGMTRGQVYAHMAAQFQITRDECHFGKFNQRQCALAIELLNRLQPEGQ